MLKCHKKKPNQTKISIYLSISEQLTGTVEYPYPCRRYKDPATSVQDITLNNLMARL